MIRNICRDPFLLSQKAREASKEDLQTANDLKDTLAANSERCVGMAANMIGEPVSIIAFDCFGRIKVMMNPKIIYKEGSFSAEEGCLSLNGVRKTERFRKIRVSYQNTALENKTEEYTGWTAQIIQHEIDHLSGILI